MPALPPLRRDEPHRYWRRRANRRVRKARLTRTALRWTLVLAAHGVVAGAIFSGGWRIFHWLTTTDEFALQRIEIDGARRTPAQPLGSRLAVFHGRNLLELSLDEIVGTVRREPWIVDASAKRILPHTVRVSVEEREPAALALVGGVAHVVDANGFVIGPSGPALPDDLPVLTGLEGLDDEALVGALRRGTRMIGALREVAEPWLRGVSEFDLARRDRVVVRTVEPGPAILLDPSDPVRNVPEYLQLRRDIAQRVGATRYVDLRWRGRISVMPVIDPQES